MAKQLLAIADTHGKTVMGSFAAENKVEFLYSDGSFFRINLKTPTVGIEAQQYGQSDKSDSERTGAKPARN